MISLFNATDRCEIPVKFITFPGGERHVVIEKWHISVRCVVEFNMQFTGSDDVIDLCLLVDAFNSLPLASTVRRELVMNYVPFARQDRRVNDGEAHALKVFAKIVNSLNFDKVTVADPHSDVVEACFDNLNILHQWSIVDRFINSMHREFRPTHIAAPDLGATKKAEKLCKVLDVPLIQFTKKRDLKTGRIIAFESLTDLSTLSMNDHVLVVDDICDGGGTFIPIGDMINSARCSLFVTHGIFSKGIKPLSDVFGSVSTYNLMNKSLTNQFTRIGEFYVV